VQVPKAASPDGTSVRFAQSSTGVGGGGGSSPTAGEAAAAAAAAAGGFTLFSTFTTSVPTPPGNDVTGSALTPARSLWRSTRSVEGLVSPASWMVMFVLVPAHAGGVSFFWIPGSVNVASPAMARQSAQDAGGA